MSVIASKQAVMRKGLHINKRSIKEKIRASKSSYLFLAPFMISFFVFIVIPVLASIILSLTNFNVVEIPRFIGLENYARMILDDDVFLISVKNTLIFAFVTGPVSYILCLILAWLINEFPRKLRVILTLAFYAPSISGNAIFIWKYIFSGDAYGLLNSMLMRIGILREPINWLINTDYNFTIVIIVQLWLSLGTGFLAFIAGLQTIDHSMYEAGAIDGIKDRFQELWYITLPSIRPQLMFGAVMQIAASFAASAVPIALTGFPSTNYSTSTVVTHILDCGTVKMEMGYACSIATILFLVMILTRNIVSLIIKSDD
jgi:multiple sugar transport system permease protein